MCSFFRDKAHVGRVVVFILGNMLIIITLFFLDIFGLRRNLSIDGLNHIEVEITQLRKEMFSNCFSQWLYCYVSVVDSNAIAEEKAS